MQQTGFQFGHVVFFGRGLQEYVRMFDLNLEALKNRSILDCCAGPASFAAEASRLGISVVACDPMYHKDAAALRKDVDVDAQSVLERQERNPQVFHPELVPTSERRKSMELFLEDYETGKARGRYLAAGLPSLPFADGAFDVVLSGNFLFLYGNTVSGGMLEHSPFDYQFHLDAIAELARICRQEVRIYPLQGPNVREHAYLDPIIRACQDKGLLAKVQPVPQRDIIGAEQMLRIQRVH